MARSREIRAGKAYVELGVRDKLIAGLNKAAARFRSIGQIITKAGIGLTAIGTATLTPLAAASALFASMGDEINKASQRTGVQVEELSRLKYAAEQSGATLGDLETGLKKMSRVLVDAAGGSESARDALAQLGLSINQLQGLSPDDQFKKLAAALSQVEDATLRSALAQEIFGKSGTTLLPLILEGADGIKALGKEADDLRITITKTEAALATRFGDALDAVGKQFKAFTAAIGGAVAGALLPFSTAVTTALAATIDFAKANRGIVVAVTAAAAGAIALGGAMIVLGPAIAGVGLALASVVPLVSAIVSPVGLAVAGALAATAAVAGLTVALVKYTTFGATAFAYLKVRFGELTAVAKDTFGGIADALAAGDIVLAAQILWGGLKLAFAKGTKDIMGAWTSFKFSFLEIGISAFGGLVEVAIKAFAAIKVAIAEVANEAGNLFTSFKVGAGIITPLEGLKEIAQRNTDTDKAQTAAATEMAKQLAELKSKRDAALKLAANGRTTELAAIDAEIAALQAQLDALRNTAARNRAAAGTLGTSDLRLPEFELPETPADKSISAQGFFSAAAIKAFGGGNENTQREIAEATKATARGVKQLVDYGGARFA